MRIFCCSNLMTITILHDWPAVSIRHADFLLFERIRQGPLASTLGSFNPPCGFFVVRTAFRLRARQRPTEVSIRHADFLLFEPACRRVQRARRLRFQSAMRIFCCSNRRRAVGGLRFLAFQSAMRIFCCSNSHVRCPGCPGRQVSIRHADFLLFERPAGQTPDRGRASFNPPCGFFVVRTHWDKALGFVLCSFNPPCGFFVVRTVVALIASDLNS